MYLAEETSGGGDSRRELATPKRFHRRLVPESEIRDGLSGPGNPTDVNVIEKGSGMSVPVDPRVEASDTAIDTTSRAIPSTAQRFSHVGPPRREWFVSLADLRAMGLPEPYMAPPRPTLTYVVRRQQWVKIGKTGVSIEARLYALRLRKPGVRCPAEMDWAAPLELLHTITGDVEEELHERFAEHRVAGEWFVAEPVLAALGVTA